MISFVVSVSDVPDAPKLTKPKPPCMSWLLQVKYQGQPIVRGRFNFQVMVVKGLTAYERTKDGNINGTPDRGLRGSDFTTFFFILLISSL